MSMLVTTEDGHVLHASRADLLQPGMSAAVHLLYLEARLCEDSAEKETPHTGTARAYQEQANAYRASVEVIKVAARQLGVVL